MRNMIVLNGPPGCGKDEAAKMIMEMFSGTDHNLVAKQHMNKSSIIRIACSIIGITVEEFMDGYFDLTEDRSLKEREHAIRMESLTGKRYRRYKEVPLYQIDKNWYSKRTLLIHVSEIVVKPYFGEDAFGHIFANTIPECDLVVVPDSGFPDELKPSIELLGAENIAVVKIFREGYDFEETEGQEKDSRRYLEREDFDYKLMFCEVQNVEGDLSVLRGQLETVLANFL
ncbi:ATP-binding protein [Vibrio phage BONAISHI]|nr:ATP-binding protein [Vibrio phage BONAISHI]